MKLPNTSVPPLATPTVAKVAKRRAAPKKAAAETKVAAAVAAATSAAPASASSFVAVSSAAYGKQALPLLGGLTAKAFMQTYWQKKPLLIKQAAPQYIDRFPLDDLFELAGDDDVESRLVTQRRGKWHLSRGPLDEDVRDALGPKDWSLLVQGVNLYDDDADALLREFRFIPEARLDDLMISYAVDGGGVGPHFDSYDVFLLQTQGQRRWRISDQRDLTLDEDQPLKILKNFVPTQEWVLEPGDMLYLPPHIAHEGVALGDCITCSIGFRAPTEREITAQFLHAMAEKMERDTGEDRRYQDPDQPAVTRSAALPEGLINTTQRLADAVQWGRTDIVQFLGGYLTEPKAHVFFDSPFRTMKRDTFFKRMLARGLHLDNRTRMLHDKRALFINGESIAHDAQGGREEQELLKKLADQRSVTSKEVVTLAHHSAIVSLWYEWYLAGWIHVA